MNLIQPIDIVQQHMTKQTPSNRREWWKRSHSRRRWWSRGSSAD